MQISKVLKLVTVLVLTGLMVGCDPNFEPFEESESYVFSIQGVLNPLNEIQTIRISPVRQSFRQQPDPLDATVTLTHVESGETVLMEAELYQHDENAWAWNYTTDMPIQYDQTYQLTATRSDGQFSRATARIPSAIPEPQFTCHCELVSPTQAEFFAFETFVADVGKLAVARVTYDWGATRQNSFQGNLNAIDSRIHEKSVLYNGRTNTAPDGSRVWVMLEDDMDELAQDQGRNRNNLFINRMELELVSAGPEWPDTNNIPIEEQSLAVINGNVENGIGHLAGAIILDNIVINHEYSCPLVTPEVPEPCAWIVED